jgi:cellulose synthase/poly-beta-1,6-N-acetylglucosamine synthase-like glycosyltransferase
MSEMMVCVAIPARNEEQRIGECVKSIRQFMPLDVTFEILVGNHSSTDRTAEVATHQGAKVYDFSGGTIGGLRNRIVANSDANIIIFLDADVTVTAAWGRNIGAALQSVLADPLELTGSNCAVPEYKNVFITCWFQKITHSEANFFSTQHLIVSREMFNRLGGFSPDLRTGEDYDFCMRAIAAGGHLRFRPELLAVHHDYPLTVGDFVQRERWHGSGDVQSWSRFFSSKVAVVSAAFLLSHLALILGMALAFPLAMLGLAGVLGLPLLMSVVRFGGLNVQERILNTGVCYLYFWGRGISLLNPVRGSNSW